MARSLFQELTRLASSGKRFTPEEIINIQSSTEYKGCGNTERAFIQVLFKHKSVEENQEQPPSHRDNKQPVH
jgi:hypothetical protein